MNQQVRTDGSPSWVEVVVTRDGVTLLDGEVVGAVDGFALAIKRLAAAAATSGESVLVRSVDHASGAVPMWFYVDAAGELIVTDNPAAAPTDLSSSSSASGRVESNARTVTAAAAVEEEGAERGVLSSGSRRRGWILGALVAAAVLVAGGVVWGLTATFTVPAPKPSAFVTPTTPPAVTLPGFAVEPAWTASRVSGAAVAGSRVISVSGSTVSVRDATSGNVAATADMSSDSLSVLSGTVGGVPALAAVSDAEALVWVGDRVEPLAVDLSGARWLVTRTGAFVVIGTNYAFEVVTAAGTVPVVSPRPEMVVLGVSGDAVIWAGTPNQVIVAATNGTPVREVSLAPPVESSVITPKVGWVRAATAATVVVGWTLPDGSTITGVHSAETGELQAEIPGGGTGILAPGGNLWVVDGHGVDLDTATNLPLPERFTASEFLGGVLYGALPSGTNAILRSGDAAPVEVDAPTARPIGEANGTLLTLTNSLVAAYPAAKK